MSPSRCGCDGLTVVVGLERGRGGVTGTVGDLTVKTALVEPVEVGQGGELDVVEALPRAVPVDELPLVEAVKALGHGVIERISLRSD